MFCFIIFEETAEV